MALMASELRKALWAANHEFPRFMDQTSHDGAKVTASLAVTGRLEKVNQRLQQIAQYLGARSDFTETGPEEARELAIYRENLQSLRSALEGFQSSLVAEKAHLERARGNMQAACSWAASLREIS